MKVGRLLVRAVIGGLFIGHGAQKLFGWFGGPGPEGAEHMVRGLHMEPARQQALAGGATEALGGAMLASGLATPVAAAGLIGMMISAIRTVHFKNGLWNSGGGYEYNLVLIAALIGLVDGGPGELSVDRALGIHDTGPAWALAALAAGAAGSTLAVGLGRRRAGRAEAAPAGLPAGAPAREPASAGG